MAIDISAMMLERAAKKAAVYRGRLELRQMDVCQLQFPDDSFDTIVTVFISERKLLRIAFDFTEVKVDSVRHAVTFWTPGPRAEGCA